MARLVLALATLLFGTLPVVGASAASAPFSVEAQASTREVIIGEPVRFSGSVSGKAAGSKVYLQIRYSKSQRWMNEQKRKVRADGTFRLVDRPDSMKARWYRVYKPASTKRSAGASSAMRVTVYRWLYLTDLWEQHHADDWARVDTSLSINGKSYANSMAAMNGYVDGWVEYNLDRKCTTLRATFGLSDESESGVTGNVSVQSDGTLMYEKSFGLGQSEVADVPIRGGLRIRLDFVHASQGESFPAAGAAKVLCRF